MINFVLGILATIIWFYFSHEVRVEDESGKLLESKKAFSFFKRKVNA